MRKYLFLYLFILTVISLSAQNTSFVEYPADDTDFPNPGRGFYHADNVLDPVTISQYPQEGITLVFREYHIDDFRDTTIPVWYLWNIQRDFDNVRRAGLKMVLRFRYTAKTTKPYGDAPPDIVLLHIRQLAPVLQANSDVILTFQAGFIGAWGEWYYTDYFSKMPGVITEQNWIDRRAVVDALLDVIPPEIQVNVRTPSYKKHLMEMDDYVPVTADAAFQDTRIARISHHNDCFLASASDVGTYIDTTIEKPYLADDTRYTNMGGETCGQSAFSHCENALKELKRFHWTYLNRDYHPGVLNDWIEEGCFPEVKKKLGYRFRLINGVYTDESNQGGIFMFQLKLVNDGFANPVTPMITEVILRNKTSRKEYVLNPVNDLRFWAIDDTIRLALSGGLPQDMETGDYDLYFNITDAHGTIKDNPSFSIRLANEDVWEETTGYNDLKHTLTVGSNTSGQYNGGSFFKIKNGTPPEDISIVVDGNDHDWDAVPLAYYTGNQNVRVLKTWNSPDTLYLVVSGNDISDSSVFYIDADNKINTPDSDYDYKLTCCKLFYYDITQSEWIEIPDVLVNYAGNNAVNEIAVSLDDLSVITLGEQYKVAVDNLLTPGIDIPEEGNNDPVIDRNVLFEPPALAVRSAGNINTLFWNRNIFSRSVYTTLERSSDGVNYIPVATFLNSQISYQDKNLEAGTQYTYRARYQSGNQVSVWSPPVSVNTESGKQEYIYIRINGNPDDWDLCKPVATGMPGTSLQAVRFFNTSDTLYYSLELPGDTLKNYRLFFNIDGTPGFEYQISSDSLFAYQDEQWSFQQTVHTASVPEFLEGGVSLFDIGLGATDYLIATALINGQDVWGNGESFGYMKYETLLPPENFDLKVSVDNPYHRIKVKWLYNSNPDAYIIERSVNDSLNFTVLAEVDKSKSYYLDDDVDSSHVYYYRMYSHKNILRSSYTKTKWMQPGVTGINSSRENSGDINVHPNPVKNRATIDIDLKIPDSIKLELFSLTGKKVKIVYKGMVADSKSIDFSTGGMKPGVYLIKVTGQKTFIVKKIVVQ